MGVDPAFHIHRQEDLNVSVLAARENPNKNVCLYYRTRADGAAMREISLLQEEVGRKLADLYEKWEQLVSLLESRNLKL